MNKKKFNKSYSPQKANYKLSSIMNQARSLSNPNGLLQTLEGTYYSEEDLVAFLTSFLTHGSHSMQKTQLFSQLISNSEKLKYTIKNTFFAKGKQILQRLLELCQEEESRNLEILRTLCLFFGSYHLKNYNIDESMVASLLLMCTDHRNEEKFRLSLNCLADLLMKLPQHSTTAFPLLLQTFVTLTDTEVLKHRFGFKLFFSLIRSLFYCLISNSVTPTHREILSLFLRLIRVLLIQTDDSEAYFLSKARVFALQTLQNLFKEHNRFLYPFLGTYFRSEKSLVSLFLQEGYVENKLALARTMASLLDNSPFNYFQLNKELASESSLFELSTLMARKIAQLLIQILDLRKTEEETTTYLKLALSVLKCPPNIMEFSLVKDLVNTILRLFGSSSPVIQKQCLLTLAPAFGSYSELLVQELADTSFLLKNDELLSFRLILVKEISKTSALFTEALIALMDHEDYKVKNIVFDSLAQSPKNTEEIACKVFAKLHDFVRAENTEGIIPSLSFFDQVPATHLQSPYLGEICTELFAMAKRQSSNTLLVGKALRFLGLAVKAGGLPDSLQEDLVDLLVESVKQSNMGLLSSVSVAVSNLTAVPVQHFGKIVQVVFKLAENNKAGLLGHVMQAVSHLFAVTDTVLVRPYANDLKDLVLKCIDIKKTNLGLAACYALLKAIEHIEELELDGNEIMEHLLEVLRTNDNYKTKIEVCKPVTCLINPSNHVQVLSLIIEELETEKNKVYCDVYLSTNQGKYKEEIFLIMIKLLLTDEVQLKHIKDFLCENLNVILKWMNFYLVEGGQKQKEVSELSSKLREWLGNDTDIPISFDSYDWLEKLENGNMDEVHITASEELDVYIPLKF